MLFLWGVVMALMIDKKNILYAGETKVFESFEKYLPDNVIVYYNRDINGHCFDFCILVKNSGMLIVEVKGWTKNQIISVDNPDTIRLNGNYGVSKSPKKQADGYRFNLLNMLNTKYGINPIVMSCVAYPFLTENDYKSVGLNIVSEPEFTLFSEDLNDKNKLINKIGSIFNCNKLTVFDKTNGTVYDMIRKYFENHVKGLDDEIYNYSELRVYGNELNIIDLNNIIKNYFCGTKQIIFVKSKDELELIANTLFNCFNSKKIAYISGNLLMNSTMKDNTFISNGVIKCFSFEAYLFSGSRIDTNIVIENGRVSGKETLLESLCHETNFNYQQYLIEHADCNKNIQVKAGAGTGKTYSMISRISFITHSASKSNVLNPAEEIGMLTFTDEAAVNMRTRLKNQYRNYFILTRNKFYLDMINNVERMRISTIHSFAKDIIQRTSIALGIGTDFSTVIGTYDRRQILKRYLSNYFEKKCSDDGGFVYDLPISLYEMEKFLLDFIDKCYNKGIDIKNISSDDLGKEISEAPYLKEIILNVVCPTEKEYSNYLLDNNTINLSEYMIYLNKCINDDSFNSRLYKFKYIFIDEFQDVDDAQIDVFLKMQSKISFNFFLVGDLKQSIYRFRGATMDAFTRMGCNNPEWIKFSLNTNYRTDKRLLIKFDTIFEYFGNENLLPYKNEDKLVGVKINKENNEYYIVNEYKSDDKKNDEFYDKIFECVISEKERIEELSKNKRLSKNEKTIAILVRTNNEVDDILKQGRKRNVIVESDKNTNLYHIQSTIDLCKLTSALCNPFNLINLYDLILSNNVNIDFSPIVLLQKDEDSKLKILIECLDQYYEATCNKKWLEIVKDAETKPILQVLRNLYESTKPWKQYSSDLDNQTYYRINYELIFEELSKANKNNYLTLDSINNSLIIGITKEQQAKSRELIKKDSEANIICITIHGSKGLEFGTIVLPFTTRNIKKVKNNTVEVTNYGKKIGYCFNFNKLANRYNNQYFDTNHEIKENIDEEVRILYVAMTRAINTFIWFKNIDDSQYNWNKLLSEGDKLCQ